jgi:predicted metalloprotease with PDZ domain
MTQFWGNVLSARSGMMPREDVMGELARNAAFLDTVPGRQWRPLIDTTLDPEVGARRPKPFRPTIAARIIMARAC